ncbi:MAG TPA: carbohydrate-binding protein, partial [Bacteroidales bacterium]
YPYISLFKPQSGELTELGNLYVNYNPVHDTSFYRDIPARIEAESYNAMSGVSIEGVQDTDGVADVGWIDPGDWLEYNINVPSGGLYYVFFRIASNANTSLELREKSNILCTLSVPSSGGWQNWKTLKTAMSLNQGKHKIRIYTNTGQFNLNWIGISDNVAAFPTGTLVSQQYDGMIYPNPVTDVLHIQPLDQTSPMFVTVIDQTGVVLMAKVLHPANNEVPLNVKELKPGLYFMQIKAKQETSVYRFVKQ